MKKLTRVAAALILAANLASAQTTDWRRLQDRATGKQATIRLQNDDSLRGLVSTANPSSLLVDGRSVACADVASVEVQKKSRRALWAVVGGAAGLAAGALLGTRFSNEGNDGEAAGLAAGLAGAGAGLGYLAGGKGKTETLTLAAGSCPQ